MIRGIYWLKTKYGLHGTELLEIEDVDKVVAIEYMDNPTGKDMCFVKPEAKKYFHKDGSLRVKDLLKV